MRKERGPFKIGLAVNRAPCRIFAILARDAATGVIFRRGPSRWVQLIEWNTLTDTFEPGQWFLGRLYEHRADLSPDGTKLIYFASKVPGRAPRDNNFSNVWTWTAISKPPYLTALALWPKQCSGTYFGGGLFATNTQVWLNHPTGEAEPHPDFQPPHELRVTARTFDPRYEVGFYQRLHRDGWGIDPKWWERWAPSGFMGAPSAWHERTHPRHALRLVMESSMFSLEPPTFALQDDRRDEVTPLVGVMWADWDHRGRLVYGKGGKLFAVAVDDQDSGEPVELADFNDHRPEPRVAPDWAKLW